MSSEGTTRESGRHVLGERSATDPHSAQREKCRKGERKLQISYRQLQDGSLAKIRPQITAETGRRRVGDPLRDQPSRIGRKSKNQEECEAEMGPDPWLSWRPGGDEMRAGQGWRNALYKYM